MMLYLLLWMADCCRCNDVVSVVMMPPDAPGTGGPTDVAPVVMRVVATVLHNAIGLQVGR